MQLPAGVLARVATFLLFTEAHALALALPKLDLAQAVEIVQAARQERSRAASVCHGVALRDPLCHHAAPDLRTAVLRGTVTCCESSAPPALTWDETKAFLGRAVAADDAAALRLLWLHPAFRRWLPGIFLSAQNLAEEARAAECLRWLRSARHDETRRRLSANRSAASSTGVRRP